MTNVRRVVLIVSSAANAVLRVRGVLQGRPRGREIVDAEDQRTRSLSRELSDLRIVSVDRQRSIAGQRPHRRAPPLRNVLQLAVAIELVTEEIAEADGLRFDTQEDFGHCGLV